MAPSANFTNIIDSSVRIVSVGTISSAGSTVSCGSDEILMITILPMLSSGSAGTTNLSIDGGATTAFYPTASTADLKVSFVRSITTNSPFNGYISYVKFKFPHT